MTQITAEEDKNYIKLTDKESESFLWNVAHEIILDTEGVESLSAVKDSIASYLASMEYSLFKVTE